MTGNTLAFHMVEGKLLVTLGGRNIDSLSLQRLCRQLNGDTIVQKILLQLVLTTGGEYTAS